MSNNENETNQRLTQLKLWMREKRLPKGFQRKAMQVSDTSVEPSLPPSTTMMLYCR